MATTEQVKAIKEQISRDWNHDLELMKGNLMTRVPYRIYGRPEEYLKEIFGGDQELREQVGVDIRENGRVILYPWR